MLVIRQGHVLAFAIVACGLVAREEISDYSLRRDAGLF